MQIGDILIIRGVTQKGKNRINEHGSFWKIVDIREKVLLESTQTQYLKWLNEDFGVVENERI